jgi:excisionase family DNA binding protein
VESVTDQRIELQAAADELGVHYQTAYRWVRSGRLSAEMVAGRYLVPRSAIVALDRTRRTPQSPPPPKVSRLDHAAGQMYAALVAGDEPRASKIATRLAAEGAPIVDLVQQVIVPPLRQIGQQWHDGELTIWVEHRASAIVERMLGELAPNPRGRRRGTAVVAAVSGDHHSLPTTMAAVALRGDNWHVHHLGADLPADELERYCHEHPVDIVVITVTNPPSRPLAETTAANLRASGTATVVGGAGHTLDELIGLARDSVR